MALELSPRRATILVIDCGLYVASYYLAFLLRLDSSHLGGYFGVFLSTLPVAVAADFAGMYLAGTYRGIWRYAGINDLFNIFKGTAYATAGLVGGVVFLHGTEGYPRSVFVINASLVLLTIGFSRFAWRFYREIVDPDQEGRGPRRRVLVVGAGDAADGLLREIRQNPRLGMVAVGMVDDDANKQGRTLQGMKVQGGVSDLPRQVKTAQAEEIVIAIPSATGGEMRRIVEACRKAGVPYRTLPGVGDILDGRVTVNQLRRVRVDDLLGREAVQLDERSVGSFITGRRVLVTGAGGSIGSELCRQASRFGPAELYLLDRAENSLFYLEEEFNRLRPDAKVRILVADVTNRCRIEEILEDVRPDVVFHAAAHKHVWLMERNFREAFLNNITGTRVAAEAAAAAGVRHFVNISTDKAVRPVNYMGLSKRLAELAVQGINARESGTAFVSVRFGNVMGSEGSVVPLFERQISAGGPVTVTHPEVERFFMTIPEAVQLVLQAGAMGKGGEIFVLDMGEQMRIADLARQMITLSGLDPEEDIEVKFIGLRPGEKMKEELVTVGEGIAATEHEKVKVLLPNGQGQPESLLEQIAVLEDLAAACGGPREILALARQLVPDFSPWEKGAL